MKKNTDLSISLLDSSTSKHMIDISEDLVEIVIDTAFEEGIIKDIPIIGSLLKLNDFRLSISDRIFARKILGFLLNLKEQPIEKREKFLEKYFEEPKERRKLAEHLLVIVERIDDLEKVKFVANAFKAFVDECFDYPTFKDLIYTIQNLRIQHVYQYILFVNHGVIIEPFLMNHFISLGLIEVKESPIGFSRKRIKKSNRKTVLGERFLKYCFECDLKEYFNTYLIKIQGLREIGELHNDGGIEVIEFNSSEMNSFIHEHSDRLLESSQIHDNIELIIWGVQGFRLKKLSHDKYVLMK